MFEALRSALRDLRSGVTPPGDRRAEVTRMRDTLVQAKVGLADLRAALDKTRLHAEAEERELETAQRRGKLAEGIGDSETAAIAARFAQQHAERAQILRRKLEAQEAELALVSREVEEMMAELKAFATGAPVPSASAVAPDPTEPDDDADLRAELDGIARAQRRAANEAHAEERLAELKRRMEK